MRSDSDARNRAKAAWRLQCRHRAFKSLSVGMPWPERLARANEARKRNREERRRRERMDQLCQPWRESTRDL